MNAESITAVEYLELQRRATHQIPARSELEKLQAGLAKTPAIRERLVFEFLTMAAQSLQSGKSPEDPVLLAIRMSSSVRPENVPLYVAHIEKVALQSFELMGQTHNCHFAMTLVGALASLRRMEAIRFGVLLGKLMQACGTSGADPRRSFLAMAEFSGSERRKNLSRLLKEAESRNIELARSAVN